MGRGNMATGFTPCQHTRDWARLKHRRNQFERYDFQSVLWEEITEWEKKFMWGEIFFIARLHPTLVDYSFIKEEFREDHICWANFWWYSTMVDKKYQQEGILRNGVTLPKWAQYKHVPPRYEPNFYSKHISPIIE